MLRHVSARIETDSSRDTPQIKAIAYQMRFDEVSAVYDDFGEFYIGLQLPLDDSSGRLQL
jgi:peroxiredoxin